MRPDVRRRREQRVVLTREQLAHFATPKTWKEIRSLEPRMRPIRWRSAIIDADEHGGRGLLHWLSEERAWVLTDLGREVAFGPRG